MRGRGLWPLRKPCGCRVETTLRHMGKMPMPHQSPFFNGLLAAGQGPLDLARQ